VLVTASPSTSATATATETPVTKKPADIKLEAFMARLLDEYLERQPVRATEAGDHRFDGTWHDPSKAGDTAFREFAAARLAELEAFKDDELSFQNRIDKDILRTQLQYFIFAIDELKEAENSPLYYTGMVGDGLDPLLNREFGTPEARMKSLLGRLKGIPNILSVAKARLSNPPLIFTETAIIQNQGLVSLCEKDIIAHFDKAPALKADLTDAAKKAADALKDFQTYLEKDLKPKSKGDFRLGRARFEKKLGFYLDDKVDSDALAKEARALLEKTREEMVETSKELWPTLMKDKKQPELTTSKDKKAFVKQVLDAVAADRPTNTSIVKEASEMLATATAFVKKNDLVRVPEEPCRVIEMPEYRRGVAVAYCDSSGPLEEKQETFYSISPTPKDWDTKRAESYYKEYNRSMLQDLTIHEAMPGHYLQLMHNNRFPSKVRAAFQSGPFVEGWAVYTEWLMAKYGYGGPKVRIQRQKMMLRACANAVLDHEIHAGTMDEKQALALMKEEAFQEDGEATGKWRRARLTSAQLTTYFYGFSQMMKLREKYEKTPGFTERGYHDKVLSFGSPSLRHLFTIMANDAEKPAVASQ
jgi:uncharacterized protein (DUF885 family)